MRTSQQLLLWWLPCISCVTAAAGSLDLERAQYFGEFRFIQHYVRGQLYSSSGEDQLFIHRFYYDGDGPGEIQINAVRVGENDYGKVGIKFKEKKIKRVSAYIYAMIHDVYTGKI